MKPYYVAAAFALAACDTPAPPATLADGSAISCQHIGADRSAVDALRIIANSSINTTDPAEVARLEQLIADARTQLAEAEARVAACDAAATSTP